MGDMIDGFKDIQEVSRKKKENNRSRSAELLDDNKIEYTSNNGGAHLIVKSGKHTIDFWPGTGKWKVRKGITSRGVFKLLKHLGAQNADENRR